jgi:Carboxypeptidase regulatory-like domain
MFSRPLCLARVASLAAILCAAGSVSAPAAITWTGTLRDAAGKPAPGATIELRLSAQAPALKATTAADGSFTFPSLPAGSYIVTVAWRGESWHATSPLGIAEDAALPAGLQLSAQPHELLLVAASGGAASQATGGEHLSSGEVSSLPLNERDFSKLLLLAAGTMTDANGAANFTQQFAVNGQRGAATVFAIDGADTTDPELGGATFSNFNVDAIREVQASSGVMPAEIGHGAASYTNVISKSGTDQLHGSVFEFVRNAAFDARNFFDRRNFADERRIPPFARNEFGFTNGGPFVIPKVYNGRGRTYYFGEYQGFRQVLGTTQVFPVPTAAERSGLDTSAFPGDTLMVPVSPAVKSVLAGYPMPNDPQGAYGARTYATSSKVATSTNQFSIRIDHRLSDKSSLFGRFSLNQVTGPLTNPDQTAINPTFAVQFFDHQRNAALKYTRAISPHLVSETELGYIRSTPFFPTINHTQPALGFGDGLFEGYNAADGSVLGSYGNLFQLKEDMSLTRGSHTFKWGTEIRFNYDATIFGVNPNGAYSFGGGTAYAQVAIPSASGRHNIGVGSALPDSLTGFLTATPFSYVVSAVSNLAAQGDKFDEAAVRRQAYEFYFQDAWKATPRLSVSYGLRYDFNSPIKESKHRTSALYIVGPGGSPAPFWVPGASQNYYFNPQPPYPKDWDGWGPRLALDYDAGHNTVLHAGGAITTVLPNLWQDNFVTGAVPFSFSFYESAAPGAPIPFVNAVAPITLPPMYTPQGNLVTPDGNTATVAPNTLMDVLRFQRDLAAITPGHQIQLLTATGIAQDFRNGYIATWTAGLDHSFGDVHFSAAYVATAGVHLASAFSPNGYGGAGPAFAPFTQFDSAGRPTAGYGNEALLTTGSHSTYHSLQTSLSKNSSRAGLGFQASYTFSKSIDDTSSVLGGFFPNAGVILQTLPQNPRDPAAEKGPSTFDVAHVFTLSVIELLPLRRVSFLQPLPRPLTEGWQILNITTVTSGPPFTVFSGIQQTDAGAGGTDRPDLVTQPVFSTSRPVREDYFGRGAENASFFSLPINLPGGTGPNQGRFGTLGRDTFRGPGLEQFDFALIKDTPLGRRPGSERADLQFRAEFFNIFNQVNFGLPSNILRGSGFGIISRTAGNSRQIQFSLKLIY